MMCIKEISGPVILDIPTDPASLFLVRGLVDRLTQQLGFAREKAQRMILAVDEACTNVMRHAYANCRDKRIVLTFKVTTDSFEILIRDFGQSFDPGSFKERDLTEVRPGGLGMHFIRSAMDVVCYEVPEDGGMLLRLIKYRKDSDEAVCTELSE
jgi:anti-sigma regulatory factor (Ser/Thr protein kinase)